MKPIKKCPYLKIKEAEEMLEREKQVLIYVKAETVKLEKALQNADIEMLYKLEKNFYDGFLWAETTSNAIPLEVPLAIEKLRSKQETPKKCKVCPYVEQNCPKLLALKKSRVDFLRKKITEAITYHNEITGLIQGALNQIQYACPSENLLLTFHKDVKLSLVFFNIEHLQATKGRNDVMCLLYQDKNTLEIKQEWIEYNYEVASGALDGTYLRGINPVLKLIKVNFPNESIKGYEVSIIHAIHLLIKTLNRRFVRNYGLIQGVYIDIAHYLPDDQMRLIELLEPLHYKGLGRMDDKGIFKEDSLLLYLYKSKKDD